MSTATLSNRFAYQARDQHGQLVQGVINALTLTDATRLLRAEGKYIVDIRPARPGTQAPAGARAGTRATEEETAGTGGGHVKREEVIQFTLQLSVMVDTGVPLSDALQALSEQTISEGFAGVLKTIVHDVQGGKDFSTCLEGYPRVFPKYYVSLVRASELSGTMGAMLKRLADYLVSQREIAKKVKGALIYPSFMLVMSISVTIFLLTVVLPRFTAIFAARKAALPIPTRIMMGLSDALLGRWYLWVAGAAVLGVLASWFFRTAAGQRTLDYAKLHIPILGGMFHKLYLARSLQTMGTMIQSGVQVMDSLQIVRDVAGNVYYAALWDDVRQKIESGAQLSEPLLKNPLVPKSIAHMIHSGEKTGQLPGVLNRVSEYLEEDLKTAIKTATQFIEPVMIGLMGLLIGGVAIAMLLPILTISKVMAQ